MKNAIGSDFVTDRLPALGQHVEVACSYGAKDTIVPFLCSWTGRRWVISGTKRALPYSVVGWRRPLDPSDGDLS